MDDTSDANQNLHRPTQPTPNDAFLVFRGLGFAMPHPITLYPPDIERDDQTVFHAIARALRKQHQVLETEDTVRRLFAAINRDMVEQDPSALANWESSLFENYEHGRDGVAKLFARAGLPRATWTQADAYNPAWALSLQGSDFGEACVYILSFENYGQQDQLISVIVQDPALGKNDRVITDWRHIKETRRSKHNALWVVSVNNKNFYGLKPSLIVGDVAGNTRFNREWKFNKRNVLNTMANPINVSLAGYLPAHELMDHVNSYFLINSDGVSTVAPYEHALGMAVTIQDFTHEYVDVDSLLMQGKDIDLVFEHFFAAGLNVACKGSINRPIPELGGKQSVLEWIEICANPRVYIRRTHGDVARNRMAFWLKRDLEMHEKGHFHNSGDFSLPSPLFKLIMEDIQTTLVANGDHGFEFVIYSYGHQTPVELTQYVDRFIRASFYVIADIACTYTEFPHGEKPPEGQQSHVLVFKANKPDDSHFYKYNKPEHHSVFSFSQGRRTGDEHAFGGCRWNTISKKEQKAGKPFQGQ